MLFLALFKCSKYNNTQEVLLQCPATNYLHLFKQHKYIIFLKLALITTVIIIIFCGD